MLARVASPRARHQHIAFDGLEAQVDGASLVAVEGGDGTVLAVTTALMRAAARTGEAPPPVILVPGGRTDLVARHFGCPRDPDAIARLIERGGRSRACRPLRIQHEGETTYGWFLSTGAVPRGAAYARDVVYEAGDRAEGSLSVTATLAGIVLNPRRLAKVMAPTPFDGDLAGTRHGPEHRFMLATTLPGLMVGLDPFWGKGDGPVRVTLATARATKLRRTLASVWAGRVPRDAEARGYVSRNLARLTYETEGPTLLDGEQCAWDQRVTVTAAGPMRFLVP